jgi:hypothetical protein
MSNLKEYIEEHYPDEELIIFDGFDDAFIGIGVTFNKPYVCYSKQKIIELLLGEGAMTYEEAEEYFAFNIAGTYCGEHTPVIIEEVYRT